MEEKDGISRNAAAERYLNRVNEDARRNGSGGPQDAMDEMPPVPVVFRDSNGKERFDDGLREGESGIHPEVRP